MLTLCKVSNNDETFNHCLPDDETILNVLQSNKIETKAQESGREFIPPCGPRSKGDFELKLVNNFSQMTTFEFSEL